MKDNILYYLGLDEVFVGEKMAGIVGEESYCRFNYREKKLILREQINLENGMG